MASITLRPQLRLAALPATWSPATSGILLGLLAFASFSMMDAVIKWLGAIYPPHQLVFMNALLALGLISLSMLRRGGTAVLRTRRPLMHVLRGGLAAGSAFCAFSAFQRLPLSDAYAIIFTTPLLITLLSIPLLGEKVGWRRMSAVLAGFVGVLVMLGPGSGIAGPGALFAMGAALASALSILVARKLSLTESTASIIFYGNLTVAGAMGVMLPFESVWPAPSDLALIAAAGLLGALAVIALLNAYRRAPAAIVAPFQYTQMLWGTLFGLLIWGTVPGPAVLAGALIVTGSGLFIIFRETQLGKRATATSRSRA